MEKDLTDVLVELGQIKMQVGRLLSDWESEKDHRVELSRRVISLEADKIVRDTTIKNLMFVGGFIGALIGAGITIVVNHFLK